MFERYTEEARRIIFFARYEASQTGSEYIEPGHLLLGIMREHKQFASTVLKVGAPETDGLRRQLTAPGATKRSTSVDLPLSQPSRQALAYGQEEAERLKHDHIGVEHLALGLVREDDPVAAHLLKSHGADLEALRQAAAAMPPRESASRFSSAMEKLQRTMRLLGAQDFTREGDLKNGRFSAVQTRDGVRTVQSRNYIEGHEIRVMESLQVRDEGRTVRYSIEIQGPGQEHRHEIDFPIEGTSKPAESPEDV